MKLKIKYTLIAVALLAVIQSFGQSKKTIANNAPEQPSPSGMKVFEVNGIKVIFRPAINDVVIAKLFITGGASNYSIEKQGIESLTLNLVCDQGSVKYSKDTYHDLTEQKGISIIAQAGYDYSTVTLRTLTINWGLAWDIYEDILLNPSWNAQSFEKNKGQEIASLEDMHSDPDQTIQRMVMQDVYKGKPYESNPQGSIETVASLTLDQLKSHYLQIMKKNKLCLVIVGRLDENDLRKKIEAFASLPEGKEDRFVSNPPVIKRSTIHYENRDLATNYIMGAFESPPAGTHEKTAMNLATEILNDRLFVEIRTKRDLSYAPAAIQLPLFNPCNLLYVTTVKPNETVQVMVDEVKKMKKDGPTAQELRNKKESFLTSLYMAQESNDAQAEIIGMLNFTRGWRYYDVMKDDIYSITKEEAGDAFRKHADGIEWQYLGTRNLVNEKIFLQPLQ